jgi:hypothetical protein
MMYAVIKAVLLVCTVVGAGMLSLYSEDLIRQDLEHVLHSTSEVNSNEKQKETQESEPSSVEGRDGLPTRLQWAAAT